MTINDWLGLALLLSVVVICILVALWRSAVHRYKALMEDSAQREAAWRQEGPVLDGRTDIRFVSGLFDEMRVRAIQREQDK